MAHYAQLDENNIVINIFSGKDENPDVDWEEVYSRENNITCKRTSMNTTEGTHIHGKEPFRMNYAVIGGIYDESRDAFIPPKPFDSWILDEEKCTWKAPIEYPGDGQYIWDEPNLSWLQLDLTNTI